ncbi:hypothetical protein D3C72_331680 [compost metagenome]
MHQQVEVVGLGDLAEGVAGRRTDQGTQSRPALIFGIGRGDLLRQRLIGVLPALVFDLFGTQFGALLFADGELVLQVGEGAGQLFGIEVAVVLRLMIEQQAIPLLQQHLGLFDGFFVVLQALAQFGDLPVIDSQQIFEATVIQLRMAGAPVSNLAGQVLLFVFQCLQTLLLRLEFCGDLHELRAHVLQFLRGSGFGIARLFDHLLKLLLPVLGAAVLAKQLGEFLLAGLLLLGECRELLFGAEQLLCAGLLAILLFLQRLLALLLLGLFFLLLLDLRQALGDLPIKLHEGRGRFLAQGFQGVGRQQTAERAELFIETLTIAAQLALLIAQVLRRLLMRGFGLTQLLGQTRGVLLQGEQGALALFVLSDALVQLLVLPGEPGIALVGILIEQLRGQRMRVEARRQRLLLGGQLFLLLQQFFLLSNDANDFGAQFSEFFLELIDDFLGVGLLAFIMTTKALQQRFGLMIGMLVAAADRARLIVLQLRAQFFDTGTARQTLAFKQFAGDVEGLLGDGQFGFAFHAVLSQSFAFLLGAELALLQLGAALVQILLRGPQA